jgi:hypothetical protein
MTETKKGMKKVFRNGKWVEGKAGPEHLPEDLRKMPAKFLTKDTGDPDRIHQLDDPHIRKALLREQTQKEIQIHKKEPIEGLHRAPLGEVVPLRQDFIDVEKMHVMRGLINGQLREVEAGTRSEPDLETIHYLWFPENNVNSWVVKVGHPPPDSERPKHLRGFDLVVDLMNIPQRIRDELKSRGMDAGYFMRRILSPPKKSNLIEVA